jgi:excisionase family DNA binding protein
MSHDTPERLLRADELASRLGVSVPTIRRWVRAKVLKRGVIVTTRPARTVRFMYSEVIADLSEEQLRRRGRL